jgi:hypothetical protein
MERIPAGIGFVIVIDGFDRVSIRSGSRYR